MVGGELDSGRAGIADAEEVEAEAVGDGGDVERENAGRVVGRVAVGEAAAAVVEVDELASGGEMGEPALGVGDGPEGLAVGVGRLRLLDQGLALAQRPVGDVHAVCGAGVLDRRCVHGGSLASWVQDHRYLVHEGLVQVTMRWFNSASQARRSNSRLEPGNNGLHGAGVAGGGARALRANQVGRC
jgi:hypothetical protein